MFPRGSSIWSSHHYTIFIKCSIGPVPVELVHTLSSPRNSIVHLPREGHRCIFVAIDRSSFITISLIIYLARILASICQWLKILNLLQPFLIYFI